MSTENGPKRLKLSIVKSHPQDGSKQVVKLFPIEGNGSQGANATICEIVPLKLVHEQRVLTLPTYLSPNSDLFETLSVVQPTAEVPIGSILNTPQKPPPPPKQVQESFQSIFQRKFLNIADKEPTETEDLYSALNRQFEFRTTPKEVVPQDSIVHESVTFPPELISQMISNAKVIVTNVEQVAPDMPTLEEMESTLRGMAEIHAEEHQMVVPEATTSQQQLEPETPNMTNENFAEHVTKVEEPLVRGPITMSEDVISIGSDSEVETEPDEEEVEKLRTGYIEEASVYNDDNQDDDFSDFFEPPVGDDAHDKIVKEILEDKINNLSKEESQVDDILEEQMRKITGEMGIQKIQEHLVPTNESKTVEPEQAQSANLNQRDQLPPLPAGVDAINTTSAASTSDTQSLVTIFPISPPGKPLLPTTINDGTCLISTLQRIETRLQNIENRLTKIEEVQCVSKTEISDSDDDDEDDSLVSLKFPIRKRGGLEILENLLKIPNMMRRMSSRFKCHNGINEIDTIDMILGEMLESSLQETFKWHQSDSLRSFENYIHTNKLIFDCVKHHYRLFNNGEYIRLMTLIFNRPHRRSTCSRASGTQKTSCGESTTSSVGHRSSQSSVAATSPPQLIDNPV